MGDRAGRAARRAARLENQAEVDVDIRRDVDGGDSVSGSSDGEVVEEVVRVPRGRAQLPRAVPALAMDPGMWLNMVNVKPPYLVDLEIESMKILFWSISVMLRNVLVNFSGLCNNSCWKSILKLCVVKRVKKWSNSWTWHEMILLLPCCVCM
jgi:hypothetical protein